MLEENLISVIIPSYNRKEYLKKAIESVLNQTYQNKEIIIVDDCSNDGTEEYFTEKLGNEIIQKIKSLVDNGCSVRKACFMLSNGDIATMLRYQNKFRSMQPQKNNNVLTFRKRPSKITDSDLQGLFMGLIRLVKKNVEDEMAEKLNQQFDKNEEIERTLIAKLGQKEREIAFLKDDNERLKKENVALKKRVMQKFCFEATKLSAKKAKA